RPLTSIPTRRSSDLSVPTCGASRYSLLTGRLPRFRQHLQNSAFEHFTVGQPEGELPESFIHHFRRNGYYTIGIGKISHAPDGRIDRKSTRLNSSHVK